jgi:hypothetical protein
MQQPSSTADIEDYLLMHTTQGPISRTRYYGNVYLPSAPARKKAQIKSCTVEILKHTQATLFKELHKQPGFLHSVCAFDH